MANEVEFGIIGLGKMCAKQVPQALEKCGLVVGMSRDSALTVLRRGRN